MNKKLIIIVTIFVGLLCGILYAAQQPAVYSQSVVLASDHASIPVTLSGGTGTATAIAGTKAPAATATPEAITASQTLVSSVIIRAGRTARVANTGSVWIGVSSTNDTQLIELIPGASLSLTAPPGKTIDLATIYVDSVTLTDGITYLALQ